MKTTVGVFFGGRSTEHEISVISALQAINAFNKEKYEIVPIYITKQGQWLGGEALLKVKNYRDMAALQKMCTEVYMIPEYGDYHVYRKKKALFGNNVWAKLDVVVPVLHGSNGEDGIFEGVLESIGIPYAGCNTLASANGMDKITMKMIMRENNIPIVDYVWFTDKQWFSQREQLIEEIETKMGYHDIVKPATHASSVGISHADNREELIAKVDIAEKYSTRIVIEDMVEELKEINCSVLGNCDDYRTSVCEEPIKSGDILTYEDKYMGGGKSTKGMQATQKRIPADLSAEDTARVQFLAGETFRVLSCHGVARVDFMIDGKSGEIYVNEINTIPGSLSFYLWEATGIRFDQLMDKLVSLALQRKRESEMKTVSYDQNIFNLGSGLKGGKMGVK